MFLTAAHELEADPQATIVLEDAAAGVQAAKAGGMAAIGVARAHDVGLLSAAGADIVVTTLGGVDLAALSQGRLTTKGSPPQPTSRPARPCGVPARRS